MKLQLTKDKTIEINFPGGSGGAKGAIPDIVGVELFSGEERGCPAVHLTRKKNAWHLLAADFVSAPDGVLPSCWEETPKQPVWEMPRGFQAPHAALAVNSEMATFGQSSPEAIIQDMMHGPSVAEEPAPAADPGKRKFGIKRDAPAKSVSAPSPTPAPSASVRRPKFPEAGVPVSENGRRFAVRPLAEEGFHLSASLPEFQALWLSRLLPEGRRPTTSSIQVADSALMASVLAQPALKDAKGNALVVFVRDNSIHFAGYKAGEPVLWRKCPNVAGRLAMREAIKRTLGVDEELVDAVLEDSLVDPRPALEPFVHPVLEQLELSRAYLTGKHALPIDRVLLLGLDSGAKHWERYMRESLHLDLTAPGTFDGFELPKDFSCKDSHRYLVALGAALAGSEVEA